MKTTKCENEKIIINYRLVPKILKVDFSETPGTYNFIAPDNVINAFLTLWGGGGGGYFGTAGSFGGGEHLPLSIC